MHSRYVSSAASGENRVVEDEVRLLREAGHDVRLFSPAPRVSTRRELLRTAMEAVWSKTAARETRDLIRQHRPDVVHFHNLFPALSPSVLRAATGGAPILATLHNYRLLCLPGTFLRRGQICELCLGRVPWPGFVYRCYRGSLAGSGVMATSLSVHRVLRSFDVPQRYLAVSEFLRFKYLQAGFPPERVLVKPNFAWPAPRRQGPGEWFLYLGRLSSEKGLSVLFKAWRPSLGRLLVAGDGPEADRLREVAPAGIEMLGFIAPADVSSLLSGARALVVPSIWYEGHPRGILEAYAAGVPVIASRIGALPEAVEEGSTGFLVPPNEPVALRQAMERLLDDSVSKGLGDGAWKLWGDRLTPQHGLAALEEAYRDAMAEAPR